MPQRLQTAHSARPSRRPNHGCRMASSYPHDDRADRRTRSPLRLRAGRNLLTRWTQRVSFETSRIASDGRSRREMAPQQLEKIESAPGNGMVSEATKPQDMVHQRGRNLDRRKQLPPERSGSRLVPKPPASPATVASLRKKREGNFPACKALISRETGKESRQLAVRPKPPVGPEAGRIAIDGRDAPKRPGGKFSCLQSIEKSRNQKILDR